jgi:putative transposase
MHGERCTSGSARGHAKLPVARSARRACSTQPYLPTQVRGLYFYLYLFVDIFSRKIVGWHVYDSESAERSAVSNDNPFSESLFKTLKYRPKFPLKPFEDLLQARRWVAELEHWYNEEHRHSAIGFVTPAQRHAGLDEGMLSARAEVYEAARRRHPLRWAKHTRDGLYTDEVQLNPDKPQAKEPEVALNAA